MSKFGQQLYHPLHILAGSALVSKQALSSSPGGAAVGQADAAAKIGQAQDEDAPKTLRPDASMQFKLEWARQNAILKHREERSGRHKIELQDPKKGAQEFLRPKVGLGYLLCVVVDDFLLSWEEVVWSAPGRWSWSFLIVAEAQTFVRRFPDAFFLLYSRGRR